MDEGQHRDSLGPRRHGTDGLDAAVLEVEQVQLPVAGHGGADEGPGRGPLCVVEVGVRRGGGGGLEIGLVWLEPPHKTMPNGR